MEGGLLFHFVGGVRLLGSGNFVGGGLDPPPHHASTENHDYQTKQFQNEVLKISFVTIGKPGIKNF